MNNYEQTETELLPQAPLKKEVLENLQFFSPNNPPWNSGVAFITWIVSILLILIVPTIGIAIYAITQHYNLADGKAFLEQLQEDPNAILVNIIAIIPAHLLTILLAWLVVSKLNKYSFREMIGWKWGNFSPLFTIGYMTAIVVCFFVSAYALTKLFGDSDNQLTTILKSSNTAVYVIAFLATFTAPLVEEVIYRGVLYSAFQRTFGVTPAVIIVTLLFAGVHVPQYWGSNGTIIMICLLSLTLTLIRVKTNNLLPCIVLHTLLNGIQSIGLVANTFVKQVPPAATEQAFSLLHLFK